MSTRSELRDSNLELVEKQLAKMKKARSYLEQIKNSKPYYSKNGFIVDDQGCADAYFEAIDSFYTVIDKYVSLVETNKADMEKYSSWAGEDD